jgi:hypothetical protein
MAKKKAPNAWLQEVGVMLTQIDDLKRRIHEREGTIELLVHQKEVITAVLRNTANTIDNMEPNPAALALVVQIDDFLTLLENSDDN